MGRPSKRKKQLRALAKNMKALMQKKKRIQDLENCSLILQKDECIHHIKLHSNDTLEEDNDEIQIVDIEVAFAKNTESRDPSSSTADKNLNVLLLNIANLRFVHSKECSGELLFLRNLNLKLSEVLYSEFKCKVCSKVFVASSTQNMKCSF